MKKPKVRQGFGVVKRSLKAGEEWCEANTQ